MIKKLFFFLLLSIVSVSCFSQQDTVTLPNGQKLIPKNPNNYPAAVYNDSLKVITHNAVVNGKRVNLQLRVGDIKDAAVTAVNSSLNAKASQSALVDSTNAIKETILAKTIQKEVTIPIIAYSDQQTVPLSTFYPAFQTNGVIVDGVYDVLVTSSTNMTKRITLTGIGLDTYGEGSTQSSVANGSKLKITFQNGSPVSHEFFNNAWLGARDSIRYNRDMIGVNTAAIATKASQSALDAEAAARVAGDALLMSKTAIVDSFIFKGKNVVKTATNFESYVIGNIKYSTPIGAFSNSTTSYGSRYMQGINADSAITDFRNSDYSIMSFWTDNTPVNFSWHRKNYTNSNIFKGGGTSGPTTNGHLSITMSRFKNSLDSVEYAGAYLGLANMNGDEKTIGNGAGLEIFKRHFNVFSHTGLHFYNQLNQDSMYWTRNPQKGHLISIRDEGKLAVKRRDGNTITAYDRVLTDFEVKSKTLTLTTSGSTNTLDLENAISIDVTLTGTTNADTYNLVFTNAREGARVSISFEQGLGTQGDNSVNFSTDFLKNDKSALGTYLIGTKMLDFVVKGGKLRATNL